MTLKEKDFIEIDFTGKVKGGEVFDSTIKQEVEKLQRDGESKINVEPFIFSIGQEMFLKAIDDFLIGKQVGKEYEIELDSEKAFGKRKLSLIQRIPLKVFKEKNLNPVPGSMFNFDGGVGKILGSSVGRVLVDFNNPLSGKDVVYKIKILRKVDDLNEKIKSTMKFFLRKELDFQVKDKKLILFAEKDFFKIIEILKEKLKEILELDIEIKEISENKKNKEIIDNKENIQNKENKEIVNNKQNIENKEE